jgi:hypothetical protein
MVLPSRCFSSFIDAEQQLLDARLGVGPRDVVEHREEAHVLPSGEPPVERPLVGVNQADPALDHVLVSRLGTVDHRSAAVRQYQAGKDLEQGRLARAVRPEKAEDLSLTDLQVDSAQCIDTPGALERPGCDL